MELEVQVPDQSPAKGEGATMELPFPEQPTRTNEVAIESKMTFFTRLFLPIKEATTNKKALAALLLMGN